MLQQDRTHEDLAAYLRVYSLVEQTVRVWLVGSRELHGYAQA